MYDVCMGGMVSVLIKTLDINWRYLLWLRKLKRQPSDMQKPINFINNVSKICQPPENGCTYVMLER